MHCPDGDFCGGCSSCERNDPGLARSRENIPERNARARRAVEAYRLAKGAAYCTICHDLPAPCYICKEVARRESL